MIKIVLFVVLFILSIIEAYHDYHVIKSSWGRKDEEALHHNRMWHILSFSSWTFIYLAMAYLLSHINEGADWFWFLMLAASFRLYVFPEALNVLLEKKSGYLSNTGFDGWVKRVFGQRTFLLIKTAIFLVAVVLFFWI